MDNVEGKVAFITGGASGIGLGMAHAFVGAGMKVVIADIRPDALERAMSEFTHAPEAVHAVRLDVMDRAQYARAADEAERRFGAVHVLCNNAGVGILGNIKQATYDDWDWIVGCILGGTINGVQTFLPRILAHGQGGHIINTASLWGVLAPPGSAIYATAKYAVVGLAEALRADLAGDNIGASAFIAGLTRSEIGRSHLLRPAGTTSGYPDPDEDAPKGFSSPMMEPREVGEIVLRGLRRNDLYIWPTAHFRDGIRHRAEAMIRGMPDNPTDPDVRARTAHFNDMALYREQTQVPPWPPRGD